MRALVVSAPDAFAVEDVPRPEPGPCGACAHGEFDMCRNGGYTERGIKELDGYASQSWAVEAEFAVRLEPALERVGVLLEPASVVAKAWEQIELVGNRAEGRCAAHRLLDQMRAIVIEHDVDHLVVHLDRLGRVDVTGALMVRDFVDEAHAMDITVELADATAPSRKIMDRVVNDVAKLQNAVSNRLLDLLQQPLMVFVCIAALMAIHFKLAFICLVAMPVVVYPIVRFGRGMRKTSHRSQECAFRNASYMS